MRNVVLYTRVSRDFTRKNESTSQQEVELREIGAEEEWNILRVFRDNDRSASEFARKDRPGFVEMDDYLRVTEAVDAVAIWEASRLARTMAAGIAFRDMCKARGLQVWFGGSYYDMKNPDQRKQFTDALVDAEHESAKSSKRIKRAVRARANQGRPHGKQVYGYTRMYDPSTTELVAVVENPEQAEVLRAMSARVLAGESCYSIARDLTARGIDAPRGATWHPTNVARLLKNPVYAGKRVLNGSVVADGIWPAIFDDITWHRLQALLHDPARTSRREEGVRYLLTGIATCGVCGGSIGTAKQRGGYRTYICTGKQATPDMPNPPRFCTARKVDDVDAWVEAVVIEKLSDPDVVAAMIGGDAHDAEVADLTDQINDVQARLDTFYDQAAAGAITALALARIEPTLLGEIASLERARAKLRIPAAIRSVPLDQVEDHWLDWPLRTRRGVIRELFDVQIKPCGKGRRKFDPRYVPVALKS